MTDVPWATVFSSVFSLSILLALLCGTLAGLLIGSLPGIGPVTAISILLPLSFFLPALTSLLFYTSLYQAAEYSGSITAIAIGVPGHPNAAATLMDGHALARRGQIAKAFAYSLWPVVAASYVSISGLILLSKPIASVALSVGSPELMALGVLALASIGVLSTGAPRRGLLSAVLGVLLGTVGVDAISGSARFTFNLPELYSGLPLASILVGIFGMPEAIQLLTGRRERHAQSSDAAGSTAGRRFGRVWLSRREFASVSRPAAMGTIVGFVMGLLPGVAGSVPPWVAYSAAKAASKRPDGFGKGSPEGIAAPEAANAAVMHSTLVPAFFLGVPGTPTCAIILGAMVIGGLQPGPLLLRGQPEIVYAVFVGLLVSTAMLWVLGVLTTSLWVRLVRIPAPALGITIVLLSVIGVYQSRATLFDVWLLMAAGLLGVVMTRIGYSRPSFVIGLIIGPIVEENLRRSLIISNGGFDFLERPGVLAIIALAVLIVLLGLSQQRRASNLAKPLVHYAEQSAAPLSAGSTVSALSALDMTSSGSGETIDE